MSDWIPNDRKIHLKIVSVALVASSIFVAVGLAAQGESAEKTPYPNDRNESLSTYLPR